MRATLQRSDADAPATQLPTLVFAKRSEARASEEEGSTVVGSCESLGWWTDGVSEADLPSSQPRWRVQDWMGLLTTSES
jgi:hypothetical protein